MNLAPELAAGLRPMALIAAEVAALVTVAALTQRFVRSPGGRHALWQASVLGVLVLLIAELSGVGRGLTAPLVPTPKTRPRADGATVATARRTVADRQPWINSPAGALNDPTRPAPAPSSSLPLELREDFRQQVATRVAARRGTGRSETGDRDEAGAASSPTPTPAPDFPEPAWLGLAWGLGAALLGLRVLLARSLTSLFQFRSRPVTDARLLAMARSLACRLDLRPTLRLKESGRLRGPIAFGLWHPTIIVPAGFARQFTVVQQEAMLAHELAHLAARDPLWHGLADLCAALLWWHPLVWWARRQLQVASETAADAASVLVAEGPQVLAECLVELGNRLTRREGLGWLGVSGFRSQLGQRVEHLLSLKHGTWTPPGRWSSVLVKSLGASAVVALTLFGTAWALPQTLTQGENMKTIRQSWKQSLAAVALLASVGGEDLTAQTAPPAAPAPAAAPATPTPAAAPAAENPPPMDPRFAERYGLKPVAAVAPAPAPEAAPQMDPRMMERYGLGPRGSASTAAPAKRLGGGFGGGFGGGMGGGALRPVNALDGKLEQIVLDEVAFDGLPLPEVLKFLNEESRKHDPEKKGINFLIKPNVVANAPAPTVDPTTGQLVSAPAPEPPDMNSVAVRFNLPLREVRLKDVLDAVVTVADKPIQYSVEDYAVVFSPNPGVTPPGEVLGLPPNVARPLAVRTFKVDTNNFAAGLEYAFDIKLAPVRPPTDVGRSKQMQSALKQLLIQLGISMDVPGKAVFYNELTGVVMVRATPDDLEIVNAAIDTLGGSGYESGGPVPFPGIPEAMRQRYGLPSARR
jgi:Zn-dependent protease with chaperone function